MFFLLVFGPAVVCLVVGLLIVVIIIIISIINFVVVVVVGFLNVSQLQHLFFPEVFESSWRSQALGVFGVTCGLLRLDCTRSNFELSNPKHLS